MLRRDFLKLTAAGLIGAPLLVRASEAADTLLLSCSADTGNRFYLSAMTTAGQPRFRIALPARGHGITPRPGDASCVVFARRPGNFLWAVDLASGDVTHRIAGPAHRRYYGHGVFDPEGRLLYVTENDFASGEGRVAIYDAADSYRRVGELPSHGIGPHELRLLSDGQTLAIANGGIRTHPDTGRSKLNLDTMAPNLAYVNRQDGRLQARYEPPGDWHQLSIRHLDVAADDTVCLGMQYQGPRSHRPPLVAMHRGQDALQFVQPPTDMLQRMTNYCGSVTRDGPGERFAVSSPRGGLITLWTRDGDYLGHTSVADGCGIASGKQRGEFWISSGRGGLFHEPGANEVAGEPTATPGVRWDNHMVAVAIASTRA